MIAAFDFVNDGRTYRCHVEVSPVAQVGAWWWFGVSGDTQRYAPFRAVAEDTRASVESRVVEYYGNRIAAKLRPPARPWMDRNRGTTATPA